MAKKKSAASPASVTLKINGDPVELNPFVRCFVRGTVLGMVRTLRGVKNIRTLSLRLNDTRGKK